jgi:hypothetical protein
VNGNDAWLSGGVAAIQACSVFCLICSSGNQMVFDFSFALCCSRLIAVQMPKPYTLGNEEIEKM